MLKLGWQLTSMDQWMPAPVAAITNSTQKILDTARFAPLSKIYWTPCTELAWVYSTVVLDTVSFKEYMINTYKYYPGCMPDADYHICRSI